MAQPGGRLQIADHRFAHGVTAVGGIQPGVMPSFKHARCEPVTLGQQPEEVVLGALRFAPGYHPLMSGPAMTEAELSRGSGAAPELVRRLVDLGIVRRRKGAHPFVLGDVHRVRLAQAFERSGILHQVSAS